jgi:hypothetical protein
MDDRWTLRGREFTNCNCAWGCPCQFNAPATHGFCEAIAGGIIDEGHFNDISLDGLSWVMLVQWPGQIADGNGRQQLILDASANAEQREALRKITIGESTEPGATHFFVFNSTMSEVLDPLYEPIEIEIDVAARHGRIRVPGLVEADGKPIIDPNSGAVFQARIGLPNGFEYTEAEVGTASGRATAGIKLEFTETYGQFNELHMNQSGVIR